MDLGTLLRTHRVKMLAGLASAAAAGGGVAWGMGAFGRDGSGRSDSGSPSAPAPSGRPDGEERPISPVSGPRNPESLDGVVAPELRPSRGPNPAERHAPEPALNTAEGGSNPAGSAPSGKGELTEVADEEWLKLSRRFVDLKAKVSESIVELKGVLQRAPTLQALKQEISNCKKVSKQITYDSKSLDDLRVKRQSVTEDVKGLETIQRKLEGGGEVAERERAAKNKAKSAVDAFRSSLEAEEKNYRAVIDGNSRRQLADFLAQEYAKIKKDSSVCT